MPKKNWRVTLRSTVWTEVDVLAETDGEAMRRAEQWALGRTSPDRLNHVDFHREWEATEVEESDDRTVVPRDA